MLDTKIDTAHPKLQESSRPNRKSIRQKRDRRKASLIKKASEYSKMCGADVCLGICIRDTGRVYMFPRMLWGFRNSLGHSCSYYPTPSQITDKDISKLGDQELSSAQ